MQSNASRKEIIHLPAGPLSRFFPDCTVKQIEAAILRMLEERENEHKRYSGEER